MINLYKYLKETALLNELRDTMLPSLHNIQNLIESYYYSEKADINILNRISDNLNVVITELENLGYKYEPDSSTDEDEEVFKTILLRYREEISNFISHFSEEAFESFNTQTRYISNLVDIHKANIELF